MSKPLWTAPQQIPVCILTGFLGAGKTTLLNRVIRTPFLADAAVIINEFGDVGIDHLLVEQSGDGIIELSDGCLCCTVRGELVDTLADLMDRMQTGRVRPFSRVIVETTGLADPVPVMQAVLGNPVLAQSYRLEGIVTVVDAVNGVSTLNLHEEARRQVAVADRLVLTKQAMGGEVDEICSRLRMLNPLAEILDGDEAELQPEKLFDLGAYDPARKSLDVGRWLGAEAVHQHHDHEDHHGHGHSGHHHQHAHEVNRHDASIRSDSLVSTAPISQMALVMFLDLLRSAHGPNLLRMKGIVQLSDDPSRPVVVHCVQSLMAEPVRLARWPEGAEHKTRLVVITRDMPAGFVAEMFAAFSDQPGIGRPDSAALMDNPLAIPGGSPRRG